MTSQIVDTATISLAAAQALLAEAQVRQPAAELNDAFSGGPRQAWRGDHDPAV